MTEKDSNDRNSGDKDIPNSLPKNKKHPGASLPTIEDVDKVSMIWILPAIALIIGLGMLYDHWQNQGIPIQIMLETAEGIEAGKTKIKSRNVEIGSVTDISFSDDRNHIVIDAIINKNMRDFLRDDSQFWVVRPRVSKQGVSGISTLFSGAYIGASPGVSNAYEDKFDGLELPPQTSPNAAGVFLNLISDGGKPLNPGDPIIYRGLRVGQVEFFMFDEKARTVNYSVFVRAPYHRLVTSNTVFWKATGVSVSATADGLNVDVASLDTLLSGGIEFGVPEEESLGDAISNAQKFVLYDSYIDTQERRQYDYIEYVVLVEDSVSGLSKGAPVDYRGVRIGTVSKPYMTYEEILLTTGNRNEDRIPVLIRLEPERVTGNVLTKEEFGEQVESWIMRGVTASVESTNLITGKLKVALDYRGKAVNEVESFGPYPVIPASKGGFSGITTKFERILSELEQIKLNTLVEQTSDTLASIDSTMSATKQTLSNANQAMETFEKSMTKLNQTLAEAQTTLKGVQPNSDIYVALHETLKEMSVTLSGVQPSSSVYVSMEKTLERWRETLEKTRPLLTALNNQPSSLLFGGAKAPDQEPAPNNDE